ncbi:MAG: ATP-binding protein, partial [Nitrospiraceae bacterium]
GMAELLLNTPLTDKQRHLAENVHRSGTALLGVINEILDFSKIEAGKLELERLEFGLRETVEEAVDLFAESAGRKGLNLTCFLPEEIPAHAIGDPGRLRQVLLNLVGNAVKFTQRGNVTVWFHLLAQDAQTLTLKCAVTDTGIGIPPSAQAGLFTAFSQADGSTTRQFGGTGLGLAIVKQLVQLMGGEVGLASAPGQGSTFWFTVRLSCAAPRDSAQLENTQFLTGLRVLIVDADPTNLFVLNAPLTAWGAEVVSADSGAAALELLSRYANNRTPFDLALLDICMPGMDGLMLARAIKTDPALRTVGLLALNSGENQAPGWQTEPLGFIAWLQKPVRQSTLRDCLRRHLQGATAALSTVVATALTPRETSRHILLVEDNPVNREVATGMLELLGYRVDSAEDGRQALERSETASLRPHPHGLPDARHGWLHGHSRHS